LHVARQLGLLHFAERLAHLGGGFALRALEIAHRGLHALLDAFEVLNFAFLLAGELVGLLTGDPLALRTERLPHLTFERLLAPRTPWFSCCCCCCWARCWTDCGCPCCC